MIRVNLADAKARLSEHLERVMEGETVMPRGDRCQVLEGGAGTAGDESGSGACQTGDVDNNGEDDLMLGAPAYASGNGAASAFLRPL